MGDPQLMLEHRPLHSRSRMRTRGRSWGCSESRLQEKNKRIGRNVKIKIHGRVYKQAKTGN